MTSSRSLGESQARKRTAGTPTIIGRHEKGGNMQRTPRRATLGPKGLLTLASVCSAILLVGVASFFASGNARTEMNYEDNKVVVGAAAVGDWHNDTPGIRRLITARDLPEIGKDGPDYAEIVPRPAGAMP